MTNKINALNGEFKVDGVTIDDSGQVTMQVKTNWNKINYQKKFVNKQKALAAMVEEGDGFRRDEVADLVETANRAVLQESRDG